MEVREKQFDAEKYMPLVKYFANKYIKYIPYELEFDDLVNAGFVGLMEAFNKYDKTKGVKFLTYAEYRIIGAMMDEVRKFQKISRKGLERKRMLENSYVNVQVNKKGTVEAEEISEYLSISIDEYYKILYETELGFVSMDNDEYYPLKEISCDCLTPEEYVVVVDSRKVVSRSISYLSEKEKEVIFMRFYRNMTLKEVSDKLDCSLSTVFNIQKKALEKMKIIILDLNKEV